MNVADYLHRIGISSRVKPDYETLKLIMERHMLSVPFENLDIQDSVDIRLDLESIYRKVVERKRGGYCYELNGLAYWLLTSLGYKVTMLSGRVLGDHGEYGPEFDHMLLKVSVEQDYVFDVGFGDSSRIPVPLTGETVSDISGKYSIGKWENGIFNYQKEIEGSWKSQYIFSLEPRKIDDFLEMNRYQQTSPNSHFIKSLICSMATPTGRITVSGNTLKITEHGKKRESRIGGIGELDSILSRDFRIH